MELLINYLIGLCIGLLLLGCQLEQGKNNSKIIKRIELGAQKFENVMSVANCLGPNIKYVTEIHSTKDGYTYFKQIYENEGEDYEVVIFEDEKGYVLNENRDKIDSLSKESIEMIKSHEFHKIQMVPNHFFEQLTYQKEELYQGKSYEKYKGKDRLGNPMSLYYDRKEKLIRGIEILNPSDTTEQIEIRYIEWMNSQLGKLAKQVEIIQGGKDIYRFDYTDVSVNIENFENIKR